MEMDIDLVPSLGGASISLAKALALFGNLRRSEARRESVPIETVQKFIDMRSVTLADTVPEIRDDMLNSGQSSVMVEGPPPIRHDHVNDAPVLQDPTPFPKSLNWVGHMLYHMGARDILKGRVVEGQVAGVAVVLRIRRLVRINRKTIHVNGSDARNRSQKSADFGTRATEVLGNKIRMT